MRSNNGVRRLPASLQGIPLRRREGQPRPFGVLTMKRLRSFFFLLSWPALWAVSALGALGAGSVVWADEAGWRPAGVRLGAPIARSSAVAATPVPAAPVPAAPDQPISSADLGVFRREAEMRTAYKPLADGSLQPASGFGGQGPAGEEQYNCGVIAEGPMPPPGALQGPRSFWDKIFGCSPNTSPTPWAPPADMGGPFASPFRSISFRSDHEFDYFISPMTNPFYFEDPRALTELRTIFIWEPTANGNPATYGGTAYVFALQGRLALNDRWSIVLHKLGVARIDVNDPPAGSPPSPFSGGTAITDLQIGPKWTFYRDSQAGTVAALGANFSIPIGSSKVFQGDGAVTPYITGAQKLGDFNFMAAGGYRFNFSGGGADMLFVSGHVDYNIANKFFPLAEVNWYRYTTNGKNFAGSFDGADLFSTGANNVKGENLVTLALGARYKFSESFQLGAAYELPLVGRDNFYRWRLTFDLIFRY